MESIFYPNDFAHLGFHHPTILFLHARIVYRHDETRIEVVLQGRPWSFDGDGALFRLVSEAHRIRYVRQPFQREPDFGVTSVNYDFSELLARAEVMGVSRRDAEARRNESGWGVEIDEITGQVVDAAFKLHTGLGPGLLESVYELVLAHELERRGLRVERQKPVSFVFDGIQFEDAFRIDLLIEGCVVVELKSVETLAPVHSKQILTYLRLLKLPVGLLVNFGRKSPDLPAKAQKHPWPTERCPDSIKIICHLIKYRINIICP